VSTVATDLTGVVRDRDGRPVPASVVLAFATEPRLWRPRSRYIRLTQPDTAGRYRIRGLPAGDYYLAAGAAPFEWDVADPEALERLAAGARRVRLSDGASTRQDLRLGPSPIDIAEHAGLR
jgi:hypothetical protein